jgi:c-di-GMP-binding flagellar brake protein YcgR
LDNDFTAGELSAYQVESRREIIALMRSIQDRNQLVSLMINSGAEAVVTSILHVDENTNMIVVDAAPKAALNQRITESENISFETFLDSIRILFFATRVEACTFQKGPALRFALPPSVVRLQRREFYRVATPVVNAVRCVITVPNPDGKGVILVTTSVQNISAGGIALLDEKKVLDNTVGLVYENCRLELPGGAPVITTLRVQNSQDLTFANGRAIRRIGCMFMDPPTAMLTAVQRYITRLEREQNARATGMM